MITDAFYFAEYRDGQARQDYLLWLLGSLERNSEHPLARAIVKYAFDSLGDALDENPFVHPTEFRAVTGRGASGVLLGKISIAVGNRVFASMMGIVLSAEANDAMTMLEDDGKTAILAVVDGKICCVLGVSDEVKSDAAASIYYLRDVLKVDVWMVTGDNFRTATAVGRLLSIPPNRIVAEALPAAKLEKIRELQAEGRSVCMVGDGINDSAALAQADVGIGMGTGTEIATEAADMILVKAHVSDVCTALHLSRSIFRRIQWNLLLSLVYNCFGIPVAAGVFYSLVRTRLPPTVAAVAMTLSSISVVVSSLSLQLYRPPKVTERFHHQRPISLSSRGPVTTVSDDMRASLLSSDHFEPCDSSSHENNQASRLSEERYTV